MFRLKGLRDVLSDKAAQTVEQSLNAGRRLAV